MSKKIIINNQSDLDMVHALRGVILHMTQEGKFCDLKYSDTSFISVRIKNKNSTRYSIYNQPDND